MVMEYLEGILLKDYIKQNSGKLDVKSSLEITNKVLDGLKEVHKAGIIHRDISPDNIMLTTDNKVKLFDFGAARFSSTEQESTYSIIIKQGYAPPEQYRIKVNKARTLIFMLSGQCFTLCSQAKFPRNRLTGR